jgi:hypothetical protein
LWREFVLLMFSSGRALGHAPRRVRVRPDRVRGGGVRRRPATVRGRSGGNGVRRPVSRVLSPAAGADGGWPFIWDVRCRTPRATHPGDGAETRLRARARVPPLFGLAPGGVCRAVPVAGDAVRSYRTLSPLPAANGGRFAFCGTFPGVAPAGRYPAPCLRGARTFLPPAGFPIAGRRPSGRLTRAEDGPAGGSRQARARATSARRTSVGVSAAPLRRCGRKRRWKARRASASGAAGS